jgi:hypothetical protein
MVALTGSWDRKRLRGRPGPAATTSPGFAHRRADEAVPFSRLGGFGHTVVPRSSFATGTPRAFAETPKHRNGRGRPRGVPLENSHPLSFRLLRGCLRVGRHSKPRSLTHIPCRRTPATPNTTKRAASTIIARSDRVGMEVETGVCENISALARAASPSP